MNGKRSGACLSRTAMVILIMETAERTARTQLSVTVQTLSHWSSEVGTQIALSPACRQPFHSYYFWHGKWILHVLLTNGVGCLLTVKTRVMSWKRLNRHDSRGVWSLTLLQCDRQTHVMCIAVVIDLTVTYPVWNTDLNPATRKICFFCPYFIRLTTHNRNQK